MQNTIDISSIEQQTTGSCSYLFSSGCRKASTEALRYKAVEQAIVLMRERFHEALTLQEIADAAQLSQFHFNRIFRSMTGIPPSVYLAAIRIERAKKLLLTTDSSVTHVCFDVGYTSLGTFTTRFAQFVGLTPTRFRQLSREMLMCLRPQDVYDAIVDAALFYHQAKEASIQGSISASIAFRGLIFIGIFSDPLPQGQPIGCTVLTSPGRFYIPPVPDGQYYLFATALQWSEDFFSTLVKGTWLRATLGQQPIQIRCGQAREVAHLLLQPDCWTDPPILTALPLLLIRMLPCYCEPHSLS